MDRYDIIARLIGMSDEEIRAEEDRYINMLFANKKQKEEMEAQINFSNVSYDSDEWSEYEEILYSIDDCETYLETIGEFYEHYDYYME